MLLINCEQFFASTVSPVKFYLICYSDARWYILSLSCVFLTAVLLLMLATRNHDEY